jgi:hypothetical protein
MPGASKVVTMTIGITFYLLSDFGGSGLACGGTFTTGHGLWAALPIEWEQAGSISCGDIAHITLSSGRKIKVPIMDLGCHLHYPVGSSLGGDGIMPYGADLPRIGKLKRAKTGIGELSVYRTSKGRWWTPPTLSAWGTDWCHGPLTKEANWLHQPY